MGTILPQGRATGESFISTRPEDMVGAHCGNTGWKAIPSAGLGAAVHVRYDVQPPLRDGPAGIAAHSKLKMVYSPISWLGILIARGSAPPLTQLALIITSMQCHPHIGAEATSRSDSA